MRFVPIFGYAALGLSLACAPSTTARTDSGQTGSVGPSADECKVAADCEMLAADEASQFTSPTSSEIRFSSAECTPVAIAGGPSGPACDCSIAGTSGSLYVGPAGAGCFRFGRAGDCLWDDDELEGCDINDAGSCDATCAELEQRIADDAARVFDASSVYATCQEQECLSVIEIEGRCFAESSYTSGRSYDCSLGGEAILAAEKAANLPPQQDERPETRSPYIAGTDGMVELTASSRFAGTFEYPRGFGAMAQFAIIGAGGDVSFGEIIDPLEGIDDCGVFVGSGLGAAGSVDFYDAADARLLDGPTPRPFELSSASHDDFYQYILELDGVEPRFGGSYGVHVAGGTFGAAFDSADGLHLPEDLVMNELVSGAHFEQQDLPLTWTGRGDQPLFVQLIVSENLDGFFGNYELECQLEDDGQFVIPGELLQAMPAGFASVNVMREDRRIVKSGGHSLLLWGSVQASHRFALGPKCDGAASVEACQASAETVIAAYEACSLPAPALEELCPDFLAEACNACPEYFDCTAQQTRCTDQGLVSAFGCACQAP